MVTIPRTLEASSNCRRRQALGAIAAIVATVATVGTFGPFGTFVADAAPTLGTASELLTAVDAGTLGDDHAIACPIPSGSEFIDSWGASRSGGRRHEGVDMIADRSTPVVAAQSGEVSFKQSRLGGKAAWLYSPNGNTFYYAHLDAFEGESRFVLQGDVIGYVGSTGNAKGPHLHFETHFDGSITNPYDAAYAACVQPEIDALIALAEAEAEYAETHGEFKVTVRSTVSDEGADVLARTIERR